MVNSRCRSQLPLPAHQSRLLPSSQAVSRTAFRCETGYYGLENLITCANLFHYLRACTLPCFLLMLSAEDSDRKVSS